MLAIPICNAGPSVPLDVTAGANACSLSDALGLYPGGTRLESRPGHWIC
jgi:hypothetical protein